jgi:O-antigen ligase
MLRPSVISGTIRYKPFIWVFSLFTLLYVASIVYAGNLQEWWVLTNMSLAFLLFSMSFALFKPFTRRDYMIVTLCMITMAFWSSVWIQIFYFQDRFIFSESLGMGGSLPTPTNHIRYSVIIASSLILCLFYAIENWKVKYAWERWVYGMLSLYFFIFLHILSVRTGLAIAYAGILILVIFYLRKLSLWKKALIVFLVIAAPLVAYKTVRGFEQKINYTIWDFGKFIRGEGNTYSDSERWESWKAGMDVGKKHWFIGTGTGHFRQELEAYYKNVLHKDEWARPHNQFINVFVCFGIIGLIVFLFILIYPMTFKKFWTVPLVPTLYLMQILSMMVEHPLDTQVGAGLFLLLTMMGLSMLDDEKWGVVSTALNDRDSA